MSVDPLYKGKIPVLGAHEKLDAPYDTVEYQRRMDALKRRAEAMYKSAQKTGAREELIVGHAVKELLENDNDAYLSAITRLKRFPVTIDEFIESKEYLGGTDYEVFPTIRTELRNMNPDVFIGEAPVTEAYLAGGTNCHAKGTEVLMYDGSIKKVECISVGDLLMGPDSKPREVLSLASGVEELFEVTPKKGGDPFVVNRGHILSLKRGSRTNQKADNKRGDIVNIRLFRYLEQSAKFKHIHRLWRTGVTFAQPQVLPIDPYILGVWLGDGTSSNASLTTMDVDVAKAWVSWGESLGCWVRVDTKKDNKASTYSLSYGMGNPAKKALSDLGVMNNKHIPHQYLVGDESQRLELLAGLIDTDGSKDDKGFVFVQKSECLTDEVIRLARSLGFCASKSVRSYGGVDYYWVYISGDVERIPCRIEYKKHKGGRVKNHLTAGFTLKSVGDGEFYGFELDGDHLYLTADFTVHHNTYKSSRAMITNLYQLYLLTCFDKPQKLYSLAPQVPIVFLFMAVSMDIADKVIYRPFRDMFANMPYVKKWVDYDKYKEAELYIDGNIQIYPRLPNVEQMVGQAIISGIMDEVNFFSVIQNSKLAPGPSGEGGYYDQAQIAYNTISRRRENRFQTKGVSIGSLVFSSSVRYSNDFLDRRIEKAVTNNEQNRHISRVKTYDLLWPRSRVSNEKFKLLVGCKEYGTRILEDFEREGVHFPVGAHIEMVPMNYKSQFVEDPENALRDVMGLASDTISPFIGRREKVHDAFAQAEARGMKSMVVKQNVDLLYDGMPVIIPENLPRDKATLRYIHVDLAYANDRCGIAMVRPAGHVDVMSEDGVFETLPFLEVELAISIKPHANKELDISDVRQWIINLQEIHGIPIACVSYDGFESKESRQLLRRAGINTRLVSVDRTMEPYSDLKRALYQDRVAIIQNDILNTELCNLEYKADKNKVDHPPKGCFVGDTKIDCVDGVVRTMEELVSDYANGVQHTGWAWNISAGKPEPHLLEKPHITKYVDELIEVEMENGEIFRCTPDHPFLTTSGEYVAAELLNAGDDLQS